MKKKGTGRFRGPYGAHSLGGKAAAANMTPEQRTARAAKAVAARLKKAA